MAARTSAPEGNAEGVTSPPSREARQDDSEQSEFMKRHEAERPVRAFMRLMKSVSQADRHFTTAEEQAIIRSIRELFSGDWTDADLKHLIRNWDATDSPSAYVIEIPVALRGRALILIEQVALADGRATPAEKRRIADIRAAFEDAAQEEEPPEK